jgi:hypothetical protein
MGNSRIKDVSSLLSSFFDEEKRRKGGRYADCFGSWRQIAGERLAAHSHVQEIENGILIVEAEHPGWIQLLQFRQAQMLAEAARRFPELGLRGISFRLGRGEAAGISPEEQGGTPGLGAGETDLRPGPFGPGGRAPRLGPSEGGPHEEQPPEGEVPREPSLEDIEDPSLRALLGELKKTVEGES